MACPARSHDTKSDVIWLDVRRRTLCTPLFTTFAPNFLATILCFFAAVVVVFCTLFFWVSLSVFRIHENTTPLAIGEEQEGRKLAEQGASEEEMRNVVTEVLITISIH
jgi:hypothetical protein